MIIFLLIIKPTQGDSYEIMKSKILFLGWDIYENYIGNASRIKYKEEVKKTQKRRI